MKARFLGGSVVLGALLLGTASHFGLSPTQAAEVPEWTAQTLDTNVSIGYGLALEDVDGDGRRDILLVDKRQFVWYRNPDWKRIIIAENLTPRDNVCIAARDLV